VLDVRRLRVLREVARCGSFARAADGLSYTPSAVAQQIAALERECGMALLERRARGVALTEAGRTLVEHAAAILGRLEAAEAALSELADLKRGRLRMASFATAGATVLPPAVDAFRARHPAIELSVQQASPSESVERLRAGLVDLALVVDVDPSPAEGVEVVHLFEDPVQLALHRDHPLAGTADVRLDALKDETWIDVPRLTSGGKVLERACRRAGFEPRVTFESDDYTVIQELVGAGVGVALLPDLALCPPHPAVVLRSLGPIGPSRQIQAATRPLAFRSPAATAMLEILREQRPAGGATGFRSPWRRRRAGSPARSPGQRAPGDRPGTLRSGAPTPPS
jgi:DNA-binding transcriptional LysR family regulator